MGHDKKMARAFLSGQHTMAAIGKYFVVHYATVSRAVKDFEKIEGE
jgi:putative transposase